MAVERTSRFGHPPLVLNSVLSTKLRRASFGETSTGAGAEIHPDSFPLRQLEQLQLLFARMELGHAPSASTKALTKSFGWDESDAFQQHDAQELQKVLIDRLEAECGAQHIVPYLYGQSVRWLRCEGADYTSSREEAFSDISLHIQGVSTLQAALEAYTSPQEMRGRDQYRCEDGEMRDAVSGCYLDRLPPVLMIHLQRFECVPPSLSVSRSLHCVKF